MNTKLAKRAYTKPRLTLVALEIDTPYAGNCMADQDDMNDLMELGYFTDQMQCDFVDDNIHAGSGHDTICYHSNVIAAFAS